MSSSVILYFYQYSWFLQEKRNIKTFYVNYHMENDKEYDEYASCKNTKQPWLTFRSRNKNLSYKMIYFPYSIYAK